MPNCIFSGNSANGRYGGGGGGGGAIFVIAPTESPEGTATLSNCIFSGNNYAPYTAGGALYFSSNSNGLIKNSSLLGNVSPKNNDIARDDTTTNATFACADGEVGTAVQMSGTEITKLPALTCTASRYICHNPPGQCVTSLTGGVSHRDCIEVCT
jgi:hypothetical protein